MVGYITSHNFPLVQQKILNQHNSLGCQGQGNMLQMDLLLKNGSKKNLFCFSCTQHMLA